MGFYVFLFAVVFPARFGSAGSSIGSHALHILAGLVPWITFQEVLGKSTSVITGNRSLVKQIVFPIEVLPVKTVMAAFLSQLIATAVLFIFMAVTGQLKASLLLVPILFATQIFAMCGVCFLLSVLGAYFPDLRDIVQMFTTINLFATPILYGPRELHPVIETVLSVNPFSWMVWCYQDAYYFGYMAHPGAWIAFAIGSLLIYVCGFAVFVRIKQGLGNVI